MIVACLQSFGTLWCERSANQASACGLRCLRQSEWSRSHLILLFLAEQRTLRLHGMDLLHSVNVPVLDGMKCRWVKHAGLAVDWERWAALRRQMLKKANVMWTDCDSHHGVCFSRRVRRIFATVTCTVFWVVTQASGIALSSSADGHGIHGCHINNKNKSTFVRSRVAVGATMTHKHK